MSYSVAEINKSAIRIFFTGNCVSKRFCAVFKHYPVSILFNFLPDFYVSKNTKSRYSMRTIKNILKIIFVCYN